MNTSRNRGFTLIEMVVVLTVISILASISIVNYRKVQDKAEAARLATQVHYVEQAIEEAILDGAEASDFGGITATTVESSVLGKYLTRANFEDIPDGVSIRVTGVAARNPAESWGVMIMLRTDPSHANILAELQAMRPLEISGRPEAFELITIDSRDLAPRQVTPPNN